MKKKKRKKIVWTSMGTVMAASLVVGLSGCGGSNAEKKQKAEETAAEDGLETVKIFGKNYQFTGSGGQKVTLKDWSTQGKSKRWKKLTDDLADKGVKLELELIEPDQYETTCQTMAASGEFSKYDLINISPLDDKTKINLVNQKQFQSFSDIWEKYSEGEAKDFFETEAGEYFKNHMKLEDGKCYWLSDFSTGIYKGETKANMAQGFQVRQDWLDIVGEELPENIDEVHQVLKKFQDEDVNQNGKADEAFYVNFSGFATDVAQWFGLGPSIAFPNTQDNDTVTSPWYQENVKKYIEYMKKLYSEGLLKMDDEQFSTHMSNNEVSAISNYATQIWLEPTVAIPEGADYPWYVPLRAKAVEGQTPLFRGQYHYNPSTRAYAVSGSSEKQEAIAKILDYLLTEEAQLVQEYGIKDVSYKEEKDGRKQRIIDATLENTDAVEIALWINDSIFPRFDLYKDVSDEMETSIDIAKDNGVTSNPEGKYDFMLECVNDQEHRLFHDDTPYGIPTIEEIDKQNAISSDLNTYSQELLSKLIMGQKSMDDWDSYIKDLKDLGLDEMISINQARYDRAMK